MPARPSVLVITGPTASGKTLVAFSCALAMDAEIISADSRQVYAQVTIGTAKPPREMLDRVPHHFIDVVPLTETYTAGRFFAEAQQRIRRIHAQGKSVIIAGGSGLYIRALTEGIFAGAFSDSAMRKRLQDELEHLGREALYRELIERDPVIAARTPIQNTHRLLRALEVCRLAGMPFSELRVARIPESTCDFFVTGIQWEREVLYARIHERVDEMLAAGLVQEVDELLRAGTDPSATALNTVGYKEVIRYLANQLTYENMVSSIKQHTRNYAKRQLTWFRKETGIRWYRAAEGADLPEIAEEITRDFSQFRENAK